MSEALELLGLLEARITSRTAEFSANKRSQWKPDVWVMYDGNRYRLLWMGTNKFGDEAAHLQMVDRRGDFWVTADKVSPWRGEVATKATRTSKSPYPTPGAVCDNCGLRKPLPQQPGGPKVLDGLCGKCVREVKV